MRRTTARIGTALLASTIIALGLGAAAAPASAEEYSGVYFYGGDWHDPESWNNPVGHFKSAPYQCAAVPPTANRHVGYTVESHFLFYLNSTDCTGPVHRLDTLRTYPAGTYKSFIVDPD